MDSREEHSGVKDGYSFSESQAEGIEQAQAEAAALRGWIEQNVENYAPSCRTENCRNTCHRHDCVNLTRMSNKRKEILSSTAGASILAELTRLREVERAAKERCYPNCKAYRVKGITVCDGCKGKELGKLLAKGGGDR